MQKTDRHIAIIGSGISGMAAAYMLDSIASITVYEANGYIGGHSRTVDIATPGGDVSVDTGFIVFNHRNYPLLTSLFSHLEVPIQKSDMSFGVSIQEGWLEYGTQHLHNIFAQKYNMLRPPFWRMIADILRFNRQAHHYLERDPSLTLAQCLDELRMGRWFREYFLMAMGGAIWSTPLQQMLDFPASTFIRFFDNHGLLTVNDQPQWYTVQGGSKAYVERLTASYRDRILLHCGVKRVVRGAEGVTVHDVQGGAKRYDEVVFACHADQALAMIENPTQDERSVLGCMRYQPNRMVLHSDISFMPKRKSAWASWVYLSKEKKDGSSHVSLSYWMNNLQSLPTSTPVIVTLNPASLPQEDLVYDACEFEHPLFDQPAVQAQGRIASIQGQDRLWFCGAYQRYGFHEDGLLSAVNMAAKMGVKPTWI